jgi:D-lactate dehydrogenase (cytochrome)
MDYFWCIQVAQVLLFLTLSTFILQNKDCIMPIATDDDPDYLKRVHSVNDRLIRRTLEVGGTCTGEHGVGYGKAHYLESQYGSGAVEMMRAIKQAVDPHNIMNPGKVIPSKD